jgi:NTE family protein
MDSSRLPIGLALGSGVARGWAHIGVLRALDRAGITPDIVCGTSIGALVGALHVAGRLDGFEAWVRRLNKVRIGRLFDFQLGHGGLIAGRRLLEVFERELRDLMIEDLPRRFACVATEYGTGHEVWFQRGSLLDAVRASYAMPGLFPPVHLERRWLFDGALVNPVPVSVCRALGARIVIAVNLNTEAPALDGADHGGSCVEALAAGFNAANDARGVPPDRERSRRPSDAPSLLSVMSSSLQIMQDRLTRSRLAGDPPDVTIAPRLGDMGLMQLDRADESIAAGERAVEEVLGPLNEAVRRLHNGRSAPPRRIDGAAPRLPRAAGSEPAAS